MYWQKLLVAAGFVLTMMLGLLLRLEETTVANGKAMDAPVAAQACESYVASNLPLAIVDSSTVTSTISVGSNVVVEDVNVRKLNITHSWDSDLRVYLVSPAGTSVALFLNTGGSGDNFVNTELDDAAVVNIQDGEAPFTGVYHPVESLSTLTGESSQGQWHLAIRDTSNGDDGTLNGWQLELCITGTFPTNTPLPVTHTPVPATSTPIPTAPNTSTAVPTQTNPNTPTSATATSTVAPGSVTATPTKPTKTPTTATPQITTTPQSTTTPSASGEIFLPLITR